MTSRCGGERQSTTGSLWEATNESNRTVWQRLSNRVASFTGCPFKGRLTNEAAFKSRVVFEDILGIVEQEHRAQHPSAFQIERGLRQELVHGRIGEQGREVVDRLAATMER